MSPSPDRLSKSPKSAPPDQPPPDEKLPAGSESASDSVLSSSNPESPIPEAGDSATSLVPKRPLMRPVSRPQPPTPPPAPATPPPPKAPVGSLVVPPMPARTTPVDAEAVAAEGLEADDAASRLQPIPPPSEPKQYRAIGLLRGCYTPSEEQFTRGTLITTDGTSIEAVLLGRVMSLVRNHLELTDNHLWVVYPRTREIENNLHVQIVGVWEPEKLNRTSDESGDESVEDKVADHQTEDDAVVAAVSEPSKEEGDGESLSPGYDDDYFSIRGEVVFYSPDESSVVIKIQQAARKGRDKAKAFKLKLSGILDSPKTLGYFWDLHVQRRETELVITRGTAIGLVPPKKNPKSAVKKGRPSRGNPRDGRPVGSRPSSPPVGTTAPRREAVPKPTKRNVPTDEG